MERNHFWPAVSQICSCNTQGLGQIICIYREGKGLGLGDGVGEGEGAGEEEGEG